MRKNRAHVLGASVHVLPIFDSHVSNPSSDDTETNSLHGRAAHIPHLTSHSVNLHGKLGELSQNSELIVNKRIEIRQKRVRCMRPEIHPLRAGRLRSRPNRKEPKNDTERVGHIPFDMECGSRTEVRGRDLAQTQAPKNTKKRPRSFTLEDAARIIVRAATE
jgi:hypothetical protein